jgi:threonine/homoserine/homoserine lactone efflux protein
MSAMDVAALVLFASTLLLAAASPGPGVAALVARVVGRGARGAGAFAAGLILGDLVWLAVAILGLAVVAQTFHEVFLVIKYAGAGYLACLAYRMWTAPIRPRDVAGDTRRDGYVRLFLAGLSVVILTAVFGAYVLAAARARTLFRSTRAMRLLNRAGGTMMAGAAVAVAAK